MNEEEVRRFSKAVFGNRHRLEVLAAIANSEQPFYVQQLAVDTGIPASTIAPIVDELAELAPSLPRTARNAPRHRERVEHPIWDLAADLLRRVQEP